MDTFAKGTLVKFRTPEADHERDLIFFVLEDREDRVLVTPYGPNWDKWPIRPQTVYRKTDLVLA